MALRFRPPLWSVAGTLVLTALFVTLGTWQLQRAQHKRALEAAFSGAARVPLLVLEAGTPSPKLLDTQHAVAFGHYQAGHQLLLDNQSRDRVPGYRVWTPLALADGSLVVVDRGWVPQHPDRRKLPPLGLADGMRRVPGFWRPLPQAGYQLDANNCAGDGFPRVVSYPTAAELACLLGPRTMNGLLLLDADQPDGFARDWTLPNPVPPSRHYAYAAQWFAFAATLLFLFLKLNLRRTP